MATTADPFAAFADAPEAPPHPSAPLRTPPPTADPFAQFKDAPTDEFEQFKDAPNAPITDPVAHAAQLASEASFDPVAHYQQNPSKETMDTAREVFKQRAKQPIQWGQGAVDFAKGAIPAIGTGVYGFGKGIYHGLANVGTEIMEPEDSTEAQRAQRENAAAVQLGAMQGGEMLKGLGHNIGRVFGKTDATLSDQEIEQRIEQEAARRHVEDELKSGHVIEGGAINEATGFGKVAREDQTPEQLAAAGAPVRPERVESIGGVANPANLALLPIGEVTAPLIAKAASPVLRGIGAGGEWAATKVADALGDKLTRKAAIHASPIVIGLDLASGGAHTAAIAGATAGMAGTWAGAKLAQGLSAMTREVGEEMAGAAPEIGQGFFRKAIKGGIGGATMGAALSLPFMASAQSPEEAGAALGGGVGIGGALGTLGGATHARATEEAAYFADTAKRGREMPMDSETQATISQMPQTAQDLIHYMRGLFDGATTPDGKPVNIRVVTGDQFENLTGQASRGVFFDNGTLLINGGETVNGKFVPKSAEQIYQTLGHEGKHALDAAMRASQPQVYKQTFDALKKSFTVNGEGKEATPDFLGWIQGQLQLHLNNLKEAGATDDQIDAALSSKGIDYWLNEASADIGQGLFTNAPLGRFMLPPTMIRKIGNAIRDVGTKNGINLQKGELGLNGSVDAIKAIRAQLYDQGRTARERAQQRVKDRAPGTLNARLTELAPIAARTITGATSEKEADEILTARKKMESIKASMQPPAAPFPATGTAPTAPSKPGVIESPEAVLKDAMKVAIAWGAPKSENRLKALARIANRQHETPILDPAKLGLAIYRLFRTPEATIKSGEFTPKPEAPTTSVATPVAGTTFPIGPLESRTTGIIKGTLDRPAVKGDYIITRDGQIRRVTNESLGGAIMTANTNSTLETRGNLPVKDGNYAVLDHTSSADQGSTGQPESTAEPPVAPAGQNTAQDVRDALGKMGRGATDALYDQLIQKLQNGDLSEAGMPSRILVAAKSLFDSGKIKTAQDLKSWVQAGQPMLTVQPFGDRFIIVDAAGNPINKTTYASEKDAQQGINQQGKGRFTLLPNPHGAPDILDAIMEQGGINLSGLSKEEREAFIADPHLRRMLSTNNANLTPDEVARLIAPSEEEPGGYGDGSVSALLRLIEAAYNARKSGKAQNAKEVDRQRIAEREAKKNAPNEPSPTEPNPTDEISRGNTQVLAGAGQDIAPPEPVAIPTTRTVGDFERISAEARDAFLSDKELAKTGKNKGQHTATNQKAAAKAAFDAVAAAHAEALPLNYEGIRQRVDAFGKATVSGKIDPSRPFDAWLIQRARSSGHLTDESFVTLLALQDAIGTTISIDYGHAPVIEGGDMPTKTGRAGQQSEHTVAKRLSGESPMQTERKTVLPLRVAFNSGTDSFTVYGVSQEKLLNNYNHLEQKMGDVGIPVPFRDINDPRFVAAFKAVIANHEHGWKGDGTAPAVGTKEFPNTPDPAWANAPEHQLVPKDKFEFINALLGDESMKSSTAEAKAKMHLANENEIPFDPTGEANELRFRLNAASEPVDGKTWSKATIEDPLNENISPALTSNIGEGSQSDESIRQHGKVGDLSRFFDKGKTPDRAKTAASFMPSADNAREKTPKEKAKARVQDREYMKAAESGDLATAQRLVDAAAKAAGYGEGPLFHGTKADFTTFDNSKHKGLSDVFYHFGNEAAADARLGAQGKKLRVFLDVKKPLRLEDPGYWSGEYMSESLAKAGIDIEPSDTDEATVEKAIRDEGYDSIIYQNDTEGGDSYAVFDPSQIKSADPITKDDTGRIIPLSERFNPASNDIRFMPSPGTVEGEKPARRSSLPIAAATDPKDRAERNKAAARERLQSRSRQPAMAGDAKR